MATEEKTLTITLNETKYNALMKLATDLKCHATTGPTAGQPSIRRMIMMIAEGEREVHFMGAAKPVWNGKKKNPRSWGFKKKTKDKDVDDELNAEPEAKDKKLTAKEIQEDEDRQERLSKLNHYGRPWAPRRGIERPHWWPGEMDGDGDFICFGLPMEGMTEEMLAWMDEANLQSVKGVYRPLDEWSTCYIEPEVFVPHEITDKPELYWVDSLNRQPSWWIKGAGRGDLAELLARHEKVGPADVDAWLEERKADILVWNGEVGE